MNPLVDKFGAERRWVSWALVNKDGKPTKIPLQINGKMASSTDPLTWCTYDELGTMPKGIVFTPDKTLLGIDIDKCIDLTTNKITHEKSKEIEDFIKEAGTYVERSPSKSGLHILLSIESPGITLDANRKSPYECYSVGRYFTVTQDAYGDEKAIRTVSLAEANRLLAIIGYPWGKEIQKVETNVSTGLGNIDDSEILSRAFASKNGKVIKSLYDGDTSKYGNDESIADAALLSHLAFWTQRNGAQMERIWLSSPLGSRQKTQSRKDYRDRSIGNAMAKCTNVYEPKKKELQSHGGEIDFLCVRKKTSDGEIDVPILNTENIARVLRHDPEFAGKFRYDHFRNAMEYFKANMWAAQERLVTILVQTHISKKYSAFVKVTREMVQDAIVLISRENQYDSAVDYIKGIVWDGRPRLDSWISKTYGCPEDIYHKAVASNWLKGLVKRIIEPGCKFDYVLVLEGEQGTRKSTSLSILGGSWHVETAMSTENKDFFMQFQGKAIIEFSEGSTMNRTDVKRMKAIITMQSDKYRPPYEALSQDFPRRCVFAMTTNETEYLKDDTGNRRWLPIKLLHEQADVAWLAFNRDQLFAEAYHRLYTLQESVHEFPEEETKTQQADRRMQDPNTEPICKWYLHDLTNMERENGITTNMAFDKIMNKSGQARISRLDEMIISTIFVETLRLNKKRVMIDGVRYSRYYNSGAVVAKDDLDSTLW